MADDQRSAWPQDAFGSPALPTASAALGAPLTANSTESAAPVASRTPQPTSVQTPSAEPTSHTLTPPSPPAFTSVPRRFGDEPFAAVSQQNMPLPSAAPSSEPPSAPPSQPPITVPSASPARAAQPSREPLVVRAQQSITALQPLLEQEREPWRLARLHYELARLYESPLRELPLASQHYEKALELWPDHLPTLRGARRVRLALGQVREALSLFDGELRLTADPQLKAELLLEKGLLLQDSLGLAAEARQAFASAAELDPASGVVLKALELSERQAKAWDSLDRTYIRLCQSLGQDSKYRAALLRARARIAESRKNDSRQAIDLFEAALQADPLSPSSLQALKRLHYAQHQWRALTRTLEREAAQTTDPSTRAMAYYRVARIHCDRLGNLDEGLRALEQAVRETPNDPMLLEQLARLVATAKQDARLVEVLERLVALTEHPSHRVGLEHRIGQLCERRLKDEDRAVHWYAQALLDDPQYEPALQALDRLYVQRKQWPELIALRLCEVEATQDPMRKAVALSRVGQLNESELGHLEQAIKHHARALGFVPSYEPSLKALSRLYTQTGQFRELVQLLEQAASLTTDEELRLAYLFRVGQLHEESLDAPQQAMSVYKRILRLVPGHLGALHALQRACESAAEWRELVGALELEALRQPAKPRLVALYHRAADVLLDQLQEPDGALLRYRKALELDPNYLPALVSLGRLYFNTGRWEELLEVYRKELKLLARGPESASLLFKMGELCEERLGREVESMTWYRQAIEHDPTHELAAQALGSKLAERGKWEELVRLLELQTQVLDAPEPKARCACAMGEVLENRLSQPDRALAAYEQALLAVPSFAPALDGRDRLLTQAREWKKLAASLSARAQLSSDPSELITVLMREAEVRSQELGDSWHAVQCLEAVLQRDPFHLGALLGLEWLYTDLGAWEPLAQVYETQAQVLTSEAAQKAALRQLIQLQQTKGICDLAKQRATYEWLLQITSDDIEALRGLERIALRQGDLPLLMRVDARLGVLLSEPLLASSHLTRFAEALEQESPLAAQETFLLALEKDPQNLAAVQGLSRLAERSGAIALLEQAAQYQVRAAHDRAKASELLVRCAAERLGREGDPLGAVQALERALELAPDNPSAALRLQELLVGQGNIRKLLEALQLASQNASTAEHRAALWMQIAELQAQHINDYPAAIHALQRALKEIPSLVPARMRLAAVYQSDKQPLAAIEQLEQVLQSSAPVPALVEARVHIADIALGQLGDKAKALQTLYAAAELDSDNPQVLHKLLAIELEQEQFEKASHTAHKLVQASHFPHAQAEALVWLARVERRLGRLQEALQAYAQSVSLVGLEGPAAAETKALLLEQKEQGRRAPWELYVGALGQWQELVSAPDAQKASVFLELGRVLHDEMDQHESALAVLRRGLSLAPSNTALRTELALQLKEAKYYEQAAKELRQLLVVDMSRAEVWRTLSEVLGALGGEPQARLALAPLVAIGLASDLEKGQLAAYCRRTALVTEGSFEASAFSLVDAAIAQDHLATAVLSSISESLGKLYPLDLQRYGLSSRDRLTARAGHPLRVLAEGVAQVFGIAEFELYLHEAHQGSIEVELTTPPSVLVPSHVMMLSEPQKVFLLGRVFADIARRLYPLHRLAPAELGELVQAASRCVENSAAAMRLEDDSVGLQAKRLQKVLTRRARRELEETLLVDRALPPFELSGWVRRLRLTAYRAALILADDLPACIQLLRKMEGDLAGVQGPVLSQGMGLIHDLMCFWVSEASFSLRRRLGMTP